jgi:membrane protein
MQPRDLFRLLKTTVYEWMDHRAMQAAAALAYYALFSIAPLLLIVISIVGLVFGPDAARASVMDQMRGLVGESGARGIEQMLAGVRDPTANAAAGLVGVVVLLFGASGVFGQLKDALNTIWEAPAPPGGMIASYVRGRFLSFAMVLAVGFLLLVSLLVSAGLQAVGTYMTGLLPGSEGIWEGVNFLVSWGTITLLFAMIFKYIPDKEIRWRDVWIGALISALLFSLGKTLIGLYLGRSAVASAYGAAGSLVVLLVWVYYSSLLVLLGAEFSHVQATRDRAV